MQILVWNGRVISKIPAILNAARQENIIFLVISMICHQTGPFRDVIYQLPHMMYIHWSSLDSSGSFDIIVCPPDHTWIPLSSHLHAVLEKSMRKVGKTPKAYLQNQVSCQCQNYRVSDMRYFIYDSGLHIFLTIFLHSAGWSLPQSTILRFNKLSWSLRGWIQYMDEHMMLVCSCCLFLPYLSSFYTFSTPGCLLYLLYSHYHHISLEE